MAESTAKHVISKAVVTDNNGNRLGLSSAAQKIADYITANKITGEFEYWDSGWGNNTASVKRADSGAWNGTFRTNLGYALTGKVKPAEVKTAKTTNPAEPGSEPAKPASRASNRAYKLGVELNPETGIIKLDLGDNAVCTFDANTGTVTANLIAVSVYSRKLNEFASNPRETVVHATELDNGKPVKTGWRFGSYDSALDDKTAAAKDILQQAITANDSGFVAANVMSLMTGTADLVKTGDSRKPAFLAKYLPEPEPKPEPEPAKPGSEPSNLNPALTDTGLAHMTNDNPVQMTPEYKEPEPVNANANPEPVKK